MRTKNIGDRRSATAGILILIAIAIAAFSYKALGQSVPFANFNHDSTSFQLQGAHRSLDCKECHSGGKYKGTPRDCENCHNGQISYGKPASHLMTSQSCLFCHSQNAWIPSNFTHDPSTVGQCSTCHNGQKATGKPSNHVSTNSQCDTCHRTSGWIPAGFNHANLMGQQCSTCHRTGGQGMPPRSDVVHSNLAGQDCSQCHASTTTFSTANMNHTGISPPAACATCHIAGNSVGAVSTPNPHPYAASNSDCSQCHSTTTFAGASFNHAGVTTCKTCHYSGNANGAMPPPVTAGDLIHSPLSNIITDCNSCHTSTQTGGFSSYKMVHTAIANYATTCQNCHKAGNPMQAVYKANHNVGVVCGNCHNTTSFN
jgi:hypothetical protein